MPTYTGKSGCHPQELDVIEIIEGWEIAELHLWPSLSRFRGNEIDLFLADTSTGLFAIEMKSHPIHLIKEIGVNEWAIGEEERRNRSPIDQASSAAKGLASGLKEHQSSQTWITATVLWSRITRSQWMQYFRDQPKTLALADGMLFRDDYQSDGVLFRKALERVRRNPCVYS